MPSNFLPFVGNQSVGQRTAFGTWLPPGARVAAYVGPQSESTDAYSSSSLLVSTLAAGLARCRAGKGDVVAVLPGHTETVSTTTMLDNLVSGTQIIGCAQPGTSLMPTFTWAGTTNTSIWTVDDANVSFSNLRFNFNGADSIDTPIKVSAAGCSMTNLYVLTGSDTALDCDVGITVLAGGNNFLFQNNYVYSTGTAVNTNALLISGDGVDSPKILNNTFICPATSTNGIVEFGLSTAVITNIEVASNVFLNKSTGTACLRFLDTAMTGVVYDNYCALTADTAPLTTGISLAGTTNTLLKFFQNFTCDGETKGSSGILSPAAHDNT